MKYLLTFESYNSLQANSISRTSVPYNVSTTSVLSFTDTPVSNGGDVTSAGEIEPYHHNVKNVKLKRKNNTELRDLERRARRQKDRENREKDKAFKQSGINTFDDTKRFNFDNRPTSDA